MTEPEYLVVLYSKYSTPCNQILNLYNQAPVDYIKFLCVDHAQTRQRILSSKRLKISTVPCVLLMYPDGSMEKFEEGDVAGWLTLQISKHLPQEQVSQIQLQQPVQEVQQQPPPQQQQPPPQQQQPPPPQQQDESTSIEFLEPTMTQEPITPKKKSITDIAAEMAAERGDADVPANQRKREMMQEGLSQIP